MKKRVVSLLLCLIMALSLIPTVAFAAEVEVQNHSGPGTDSVKAYHIDVRVNAKLTIDRQSNGTSQSGYPKEVPVTVTNVTGTVDGKSITFWRKLGPGNENEWRADGIFNSNQKITLTCTLKLSDSDETFTYTHTYTAQELENAKNTCPTKLGFDINIYAEDIQDTITKTVKFFTADKDMGLLNTTEESVTHANLVVNSEFPARPTTNPLNGYEFDGWYEADANGNKTGTAKITTFPEKVTADAYYVAVWKTAAPTTGMLTITKNITGLDNPNTQFPNGITFTVKDSAGNTVATEILKDFTQVTSEAGKYTQTKSIELNADTYTVTESNAAVQGYTLAPVDTVTADLSNGDAEVVFNNAYTPNTGDDENNYATITINKYETGDNAKKPIGGAKFYLEKLDKNSTVISGTYYDTVAGKALTIGNLTEGNYRLTEAEAPFGYQKVNTVWTFTVTKTTTTDINSENQQVTTNTYKITKVDNSTCDEATHVFDVANTKLPNVTAKITITKNVNVTGNTQPTTMPTFQFVAKVGSTEVGKLSLTPTKGTDGKWTASGVMDITIPATLFVKDTVDVKISEVDGKLNYWTYDKNVKSLQIAKNGTIHNPVIVKSAAEVVPTDPIASFTFTNEYKYTYTPPTRPSDPIRRQPTTTTTKPVQSVKTGDMGIALYAVTSLLSLSGTALLIKKRKDEK